MLSIKAGDKAPALTLRQYKDGAWSEVDTAELFADKTVIFGLPGAFTPTCSSAQVPGYENLAPVFHKLGVKNIVMTTVNDPFVVDCWRKDQGADQVQFLADGNGALAEAFGALVDKADLNFGKRSWRYAMVIDNGVVEKVFAEPNVPGDPYGESAPETVLEYLQPGVELPKHITILTKFGCPFCSKAKALLDEKGLTYRELQLARDIDIVTMQALSGSQSAPQVFIDGTLIGGSDKLEAYFA